MSLIFIVIVEKNVDITLMQGCLRFDFKNVTKPEKTSVNRSLKNSNILSLNDTLGFIDSVCIKLRLRVFEYPW